MTEPQIRVLLVDDHQVLREGLRLLLEGEEDMVVVSEAGTGKDAIRLASELHPDVIVMDLGLPDGNGINAIREIRSQERSVRIVVLSMYSDRELVMKALEAGSDGYVPKSSAHSDLLQAIRAVHIGQRYLHPIAATAVVDEMLEKQEGNQLLEILSEREREVLRLTAMGFTSRDIGDRLALSPKTVDTYRQRAMNKLELESRAELIRFALRAGLMEATDKDD
ncbi:MAG: response regulator transcription factor [Anaerolineae bacterium]|jgi:two-component system response regulator NreC|nr:response regulator transcription factor [Anaerolineae bacterium]MBT7602411.1 response regulator transcription factor [Anaerolineae bacterium]MBT7988870.1 response regulator transcription factor [Anaerolineae bacterium]